MELTKEFLDNEIKQINRALVSAEQQVAFTKGALSMLEQLRGLIDAPVVELEKENAPE